MTVTQTFCDLCGREKHQRDEFGPMDLKTFCYSQNPFGELNGCHQNSRLQWTDVCLECSSTVSAAIVKAVKSLQKKEAS